MKKVEDKFKSVKDLEKSIYAGVLTIMTIFIGIFSLINFEISFIKGASLDFAKMLTYNLIFVGGLSSLIALVNCILPYSEGKRTKLFIIPVVCFIAALVMICVFR